MEKRWKYFLSVFGLSLFVDQSTKYWAIHILKDGSIPLIRGILELRLRHNVGSAFGVVLLGRTAIFLLTIVLSVVFVIWITRVRREQAPFFVGIALYLAGAWGNLLDRLRWGHVIDFIEPSFWATFNLGDVMIVGGVGLLLSKFIFRSREV